MRRNSWYGIVDERHQDAVQGDRGRATASKRRPPAPLPPPLQGSARSSKHDRSIATPAKRSAWTQAHASGLGSIAEKTLDAGERLSFEDGVALYRTATLSAVGATGQRGPRAPARRPGVLQRQPAHQLHERTATSCARFCAFQRLPGPGGRLRDEAGRGRGGEDPRPARTSRSPRCTWSRASTRSLPYSYYLDILRAVKDGAAGHPRQGVHDDRAGCRSARERQEAPRRRFSPELRRSRPGLVPRRRRRDLRRPRAPGRATT